MNPVEFAKIIAYIGVACGKPLTAEAQVVYFDLLGDLPADVFQLAAKRVLMEHRWATFPSVAELRQAASESVRGEVKELASAEAWAMAWWIIGNCDPEMDGSFERACKRAKAPPLVVESVRSMSLAGMCYGDEPVGVIRGQFLKVFEQLQGRDRRLALLPPSVKEAITSRREAVGNGTGGAIVGGVAASFGGPT